MVPVRVGTFQTRRDRVARQVAMLVTVVAALAGVLAVAAAAVALAIT